MHSLRAHWTLDPDVVFLNHGSFGACPRAVLDAQAEWRARLERQPVAFYLQTLPKAHDAARERVAEFVGADPAGFAFVRNASAGVNAVLRSLRFEPGDELLVTSHEYPACRNALEFVAQRWGAKVVVAELPFVGITPDVVVERVLGAVTARTKLALIDHITSQTGLVLPIERLVPALQDRGVDVLVDGAHGPGMVPLNLDALGAAYYTANLHKWVCAPKGAAFLVVRADRRTGLHPTSISHGHRFPLGDRSRFHLEFDWCGTDDPTSWLTVPTAIDTVGALLPGGWDAVRAHNRALVLQGRDILLAGLGVGAPCPDEMIGALASVPLPDGDDRPLASPLYRDPLQVPLLDTYRIEVPIVPFPAPPKRLVRVSAQLYNQPSDYQALSAALTELLAC